MATGAFSRTRNLLWGVAAAWAFLAPGGVPQAAAPPFDRGEDFDLGKLRGRVVALYMSRADRKESDGEMRAFEKFRKSAPQGVDAVYVDVCKTSAPLSGMIERTAPGCRIVSDPQGVLARRFGLVSVPTYYLIGKWGQVRFQGSWNESQFVERAKVLLAETAPAKENFFLEQRMQKGSKAPLFAVCDPSGKTLALKDYLAQSRAVLVVFGDPASDPARKVFSRLNALGRIHRKEGLAILPIHLGDYGDEDRGCYDALALEWPLGIDSGGNLAGLYGVESAPAAFLIESSGRIFRAGLYDPPFEKAMQTFLRVGSSDSSSWNVGAMLGGSTGVSADSAPSSSRNAGGARPGAGTASRPRARVPVPLAPSKPASGPG